MIVFLLVVMTVIGMALIALAYAYFGYAIYWIIGVTGDAFGRNLEVPATLIATAAVYVLAYLVDMGVIF